MSGTVDRILDVLDVGLQTSTETGYGTDHDAERCARCQRHDPAEGGDLCPGCRAFLLGDSDDDPTASQMGRVVVHGYNGETVVDVDLQTLRRWAGTISLGATAEQAAAAIRRVADACADDARDRRCITAERITDP